jgi:L-alanine-DL-glutamate epimerase-like enolase superfamily enzyme
MRIEALHRYPVVLGHVSGNGASGNTVIVRIWSDSGATGLGEAVIPADGAGSPAALLDQLERCAAALAGADAMNLNQVHRILDGAIDRDDAVGRASRAAIDMAVHDLIGHARARPVHALLGGAYQTELDLFVEITADHQPSAAQVLAGRGYRAMKIDIGVEKTSPLPAMPCLARQASELAAILRAIDAGVYLDAAAHGSLGNPALARTMIEAVLRESFHPNLGLRQPLGALELDGHALLRETLPIPVILVDSVISPEAMAAIVRAGAADRIVLDAERVGGLRNAARIADICEAAAIGVTASSLSLTRIGAAAACHLSATLHDRYPIDLTRHLGFADSPVKGGFEICGGRAIISDGHGLGVTLDDSLPAAMGL